MTSFVVGSLESSPLSSFTARRRSTPDVNPGDLESGEAKILKLAFHEGSELSTEHLLRAVPEVRLLSQTDPERVAAMTEWLDRHTKAASSRRRSDGPAESNGAKRKRRVAV